MAPLPAFVTGADAPSFRSSAPWTGSGAAGVGACTFGFGARKDIGLWFLSGGGDSLQIVDDLLLPLLPLVVREDFVTVVRIAWVTIMEMEGKHSPKMFD